MPIPLWRRRRSLGVPGMPRSSPPCLCSEADVRTSGNYGRGAILSGGGVRVHLYVHARTAVITAEVTTAGSSVGVRDARAGRVVT